VEPEGGAEEATADTDAPELDAGAPSLARARRFGPPRAELWVFVEFFAVCGFLVAQPLFDFLGKNQTALMVLRLSLRDALVFTVLVLLVPPMVLWAFEVLVGLVGPAGRRPLHVVLLSLGLGLVAANILKVQTHVGFAPRLLMFVAIAGLAAWALLRWSPVWQWLHVLAIAPLVFAFVFVAASPTSVLYSQHPNVASVAIARPARVVMIVFDEFTEESLLDANGHIDRELFPNFARLAGDGTWYRNESTVGLYTGRAVPAILTGRMPPTKTTPPIAESYPQTLFTLLGDTYDMHAQEHYEQLCPTSLCTEPKYGSAVGDLLRASQHVMHNLMAVDRKSLDRNDGFRFGVDTLLGKQDAAALASDFVASLEPSKGPRLDYLHVLLPHAPWRYLENFRDRGRDTAMLQKLHFKNNRILRSLGRRLQLFQVQATDWFVGQVIDRLQAIGEYDDSLVVVTADHGVAFPYYRALTPRNYPDLMWTPLFIKAPGQSQGRIDDRPMLSIDVLPTMADILGVRIPWKVDGLSAARSRRPEGDRPIVTAFAEQDGEHREYDGAAGFASMLQSGGVSAGGDPDLRLYRVGKFGALVGRSTTTLVRAKPPGPAGTLTSPARWEIPDPDARSVPWSIAHGSVQGVPTGHTIAVAVNGRIAGLALVDKKHQFDAPLSPKFFVAGTNRITPYLVRGSAAAPGLSPIRGIGADG
jgi:hypothetical protein